MHYVIFVDDKMLAAPVEKADADYLCKIAEHLKPISDGEYMDRQAVFLQTLARFSYIVYDKDLYWCVEWQPGLVVTKFLPGGALAAAAFRSPIPNFGGRKAKKEELENYDEDAENHQYNLVFRAWDAQFDWQWRKWRKFKAVDKTTQSDYYAALAHVDSLGAQLEKKYKTQSAIDKWRRQCGKNIDKWAGEGIRL
jgi:hypothetical protein